MLLISLVVVPAPLVPVHGLVGRSGAVINAELGIGLLAGYLDSGLDSAVDYAAVECPVLILSVNP